MGSTEGAGSVKTARAAADARDVGARAAGVVRSAARPLVEETQSDALTAQQGRRESDEGAAMGREEEASMSAVFFLCVGV